VNTDSPMIVRLSYTGEPVSEYRLLDWKEPNRRK
jgi:hypothetical protein